MSALSALSAPLSDAEYATLAAALPGSSPFDADGVLGVLHAVASAPSLLLPSEWLPVLLPEGPKGEGLLGLVLRLYNEVIGDLERHESMIPRPEEAAACASFAAGYVAGAELDAEWRDDACPCGSGKKFKKCCIDEPAAGSGA